MISMLAVTVRQGKAYVPVKARTDTGLYMDAAPVFIGDLSLDGLRGVLELAAAAGHPPIPHPTQEGWRHWRSPVLKAAGVRSWKQMASGAVSYLILWGAGKVVLRISEVEEGGDWRKASYTDSSFAPDVGLGTLAEAILQDLRERQKAPPEDR